MSGQTAPAKPASGDYTCNCNWTEVTGRWHKPECPRALPPARIRALAAEVERLRAELHHLGDDHGWRCPGECEVGNPALAAKGGK